MKLRTLGAFAAGLAAAAILYKVMVEVSIPIRAWYLHKYLRPIDPGAIWPVLWPALDFQMLPLVALIIGGLVAGCVYNRRSFLFAALVGIAFGIIWFVGITRLKPIDVIFVTFLLAVIGLSTLACHVGQRLLSFSRPDL
jgi:hypothetical protein